MWVFADFGLLMPASIPALDSKHLSAKDRDALSVWSYGGIYDLQVRARAKEHLQHFMDNYMEVGTFNPEMHATPEMDYNFRFYTTRKAFAQAMALVIEEIDYEKFKPTAERYSWGKQYHSVLNSIWGTVCRLGAPGGVWGPRSTRNPNGYGKASKYAGLSGSTTAYSYRDGEGYRSIGSSFFDLDDEIEDDNEYWTPDREEEIEEILHDMEGIPVDQWEDFLTETQMALVRDIANDEIEARETQRLDASTRAEITQAATPSRKERRRGRRKAERVARENKRKKNFTTRGRHVHTK